MALSVLAASEAQVTAVERLFLAFLAVTLLILVATHVAGLLAARGRRTDRPTRNPAAVVALWGVIFLGITVGLYVTSEHVGRRVAEARGVEAADVQRVMVIGERFAWSVILPGPDGELGTYLRFPDAASATWPLPAGQTTFRGARGPAELPAQEREEALAAYVDTLNPYGRDFGNAAGDDDDAARASAIGRPVVVEAGRPVEIVLGSRDVIHSFYVPAMRTKLDAVPGLWGRLRLDRTTPGEYDVFCAEFCGWGHYTMGTRIIVVPPGDGPP